ncbi:MAG: hypothetical protein P1U39_02450 [Legionellaceae bacterium]|nr:hypothetical protein [Legionellaceae bacterium]
MADDVKVVVFLGTDTIKTVDNYVRTQRGELFSYVSDRIPKPSSEQHETDYMMQSVESHEDWSRVDATAIERDSSEKELVHVYDGPKTFGADFYHIMAQGVSDLLPAIAGGQTVLNIIGHSRGAVESIIASHELDRIQKILGATDQNAINSPEALLELLCDSEHKETKQYLNTKLEPYINELFDNLSELITNMAKVKVNLFLLDPVPGGSVLCMTGAKITDARYFKIPTIVNDCQEILLENERTRGFKAIVPHVVDPKITTFTLINLPGHHGTASGNPYDQQLKNRPKDSELKTKEVHDISLYMLYDFLDKHGVAFDSQSNASRTNLLISNDLDQLFENYRAASSAEKSEIKLAAYNIILENKSAYEAFNQTTYFPDWLFFGHEGSIQAYLSAGALSLNHDRIIHVGGPGDTFLKGIVSFQSDAFVNAAHARLFLRNELKITDDQTPVESLLAILDNFDQKVHDIHHIFEQDSKGELTQAIKSSLQMMFSGLMQTYLRNNLSAKAQGAILEVIERTINIKLSSDNSTEALVNLVQDLKLYLVENLSKDLHALTVSHQQDVFNLLNSDELSIAMLQDKTSQLKQFEVHLQVLTKYFAAFECVQPQLKASQNVLNDSLDLLTSCRATLTKHKHQLLILSSFHDRALSGLQASMQEENEQLQARIEIIRQENTEIHAELQEQQRAHEALQAEKARVDAALAAQITDNHALSGEHDTLRTERDNLIRERDTQAERIAELERRPNVPAERINDLDGLLARPVSDGLFHGVSLEILGTFALVLGSAVVALSLVALMLTPVAPIVPLGIALAGAGLATAGFFGMKQGVEELHQEALYQSSLN